MEAVCPADTCDRDDFESYYALGMHFVQSHSDTDMAEFGSELVSHYNPSRDVDTTVLDQEHAERLRTFREPTITFDRGDDGMVHLCEGDTTFCVGEFDVCDSRSVPLNDLDGQFLQNVCESCARTFESKYGVNVVLFSPEQPDEVNEHPHTSI